MPHTSRFLITLSALFFLGTAQAHDFKAGAIEIGHAWARATPRGASVAAGYLKLSNTGTTPDRLIGASAAVSDRVEVHEMATVEGVLKMRPVKDGLEIKTGQSVELKPGGLHLMMFDLKQQLQQGQRVKGTLVFEKAGKVDIEFAVEGIGGAPAHGAHGH